MLTCRVRNVQVVIGLVCGVVIVNLFATAAVNGQTPPVTLVINEVDYDQPGTDGAEFIEIKNTGLVGVNLDPVLLVLVNGFAGGAAIYQTIDLPAVVLPPGGYFVVCGNAANVPNCNLDVSPDTNLIQNGAPDAVALVQDGAVIDAVSYEGNTAAPYTEGSGAALVDDGAAADTGLSRFPDGADTNQNNVDLSVRCITPGGANRSANDDCVEPDHPVIVINEIMQNPAAVADSSGEWFELYNPMSIPININGWRIADNGSDSHIINHGGPLSIPAGGFLVLGNNADMATNGGVVVDYRYSGVALANGADEIILRDDDGNEVDRVEYDDGATFPDPTGASMALADPALDNNVGTNWCTSSTTFGNGDRGTPGAPNDCGGTITGLVINEIDYDQPGTDTAEFVEIKNVGESEVSLAGVTLELINGSGGGAVVYDSIALPNVLLPVGGYFVVCGDATNVPTCDFVVAPSTNLIQNGSPDAVALVHRATILDTVSYEGDAGSPYTEGSGTGLEDDPGLVASGISRCPDGSDTDLNNVDFIPAMATPGAANDCDRTPPDIDCPDDIIAECTGSDGAVVTFEVTATDAVDPNPLVSCDPASGSVFPSGETTVNCTATDASGNSANCAFDVSVEDATPPDVHCMTASTLLWPANHNLVDVGLTASADDTCDPELDIVVTVYSDEDDEWTSGDGNQSPDAKQNAGLRLRSERRGDGNGRVYLIVTTATDDSENVGVACCAVVVPHGQSKAEIAAVNAEAAEAVAACGANGSPTTPFLVGDGPIIGPKQ